MTLGFGLAAWVPYIPLQLTPIFDFVRKDNDVISIKVKEK